MKFAAILIAAVAFVVWQSPTLAADIPAPADSAKDDLPVIQGQVVNNSGKAVPGAKVFLLEYSVTGEPTVKERLYADKRGAFRFKPKEKPKFGYQLVVATANLYSYGYGMYMPERPQAVKIALWPERVLSGKVEDENGKPVPGATVSVSNFAGRSRSKAATAAGYAVAEASGSVVSDSTGKFRLSHVPDPRKFDDFYLILKTGKPGRATVTQTYNRAEITKGLSILSPPACVLEGTLYLPGKSGPAPNGTTISVQLQGQDASFGGRYAAVDQEGKFRLDDLPFGEATVSLGPPPFTMRSGFPVFEAQPWTLQPVKNIELNPEQPAKIDLVLAQGSLIKGVVKNKTDDKPIPNAILNVSDSAEDEMSYPNFVVTDENGNFTARAAPGKVEITIYGIDKEDSVIVPGLGESMSLDIAEGEEKTDIVFSVDPTMNRYTRGPEIAADFELKAGTYDLAWDANLDCSDMGVTGEEKCGKDISSKLKGTPKFVSQKVHYGSQRLDGKEDDGLLVFALDESKGTGKGYDQLYLDANRNWDLSDDKPITITNMKGGEFADVGKLTVQSRLAEPAADGAAPSIQISLEIHEAGPDSMCVHLSRNGGWKGTVETAKGKAECVVLDTNLNSVCGEPTMHKETGEVEFEGDKIFVGIADSGTVSLEEWGIDCITLYPVTRIGEKFYSITVSETGDKLTVEPYSGPTGTLLVRGTDIQGLSASSSQLTVAGTAGAYSVSSEGKAVTLPAGSYSIRSCSLNVESKKGSLPLDCETSLPAVVNADEETTLDITGKLSLAVDPDKKNLTWKAGTTEGFEWVIRIGEAIKLISIGDRSSPPVVKFHDAKGKLLKTVNAGYT